MELPGDLFENEQRIRNSIQNGPTTLQRNKRKERGTLDSKLETKNFDNRNRQSDNSSCHSMGCSYLLLYDQHLRTSNADFSRLSDGIGDRNARKQIIKFQQKVNLEIHHLFLWDDHRKLVKNQAPWQFRNCAEMNTWFHLVSQIPKLPIRTCAMVIETKNETMLRELQNDDGMQNMRNTNDLASLIRLLKDKEPYREETNKDVFTKSEIHRFPKTYGITDFQLMFACGDSVFWLEDHGVSYFWSRIDDSMIRGGGNLKEALTNYLFNQENLCYVDEITRELVPINAYDKEAEEWVNSIDVTKVS
ncbi:hypothetical protein C1646_685578 [Rhizophagus diaphanus]|nr:hypothetical protein C1646_685578 [Rhizophagus diaphanus] [Rhizophagus sp. MUCL 43196]